MLCFLYAFQLSAFSSTATAAAVAISASLSDLRTAERTFVKFGIGEFHSNLLVQINCIRNSTTSADASHESLYPYLKRNFSCRSGKCFQQKLQLCFKSNLFFRKTPGFRDIQAADISMQCHLVTGKWRTDCDLL
jgi:hypothetical protein